MPNVLASMCGMFDVRNEGCGLKHLEAECQKADLKLDWRSWCERRSQLVGKAAKIDDT